MRILTLDIKKGHVKLNPENLDDLWLISELLKQGDLVGMRSLRKIKLSLGDRSESEKKPMFLKLSVASTKFQEYTGNLRIKGEIVEGPEDIKGSHSFSIDEKSIVEIWKDLSPLDIDMLKKSKLKQVEVAFVLLDRDEALIVHGGKKFWIKSGLPSKRSDEVEDYRSFFGQIKMRLKEISPEYVVVAGPGFTKDKFSSSLEMRHVVEGASSVSESGMREVISRGALEKIGAVIREAEEQKAVDRVFNNIHNNKAFYGWDDVLNFVEQKNVLELVVSSKFISESIKSKKYSKLRSIIEKIKYTGGKIMLIGRNKDTQSRLDGLGGIAGLKRW